MELRKHNGGHVPAEITDERGRLLDLITDMHQYFYDKTAALWGDPDQLVSLSELLMSVGHAAQVRRDRHARQEVPQTDGRRAGRPQATTSKSVRVRRPTCS